MINCSLVPHFEFFFGGKAIFTVSNGKGERYTYKISKSDSGEVYFTSLLTGSDNESSYTYMGLADRNSFLRLTGKSKYSEDSLPVKVFKWALKQIKEGKSLKEGYSIQHAGKCCRCGRTLTTPDSIGKGIGPECEKMAVNFKR